MPRGWPSGAQPSDLRNLLKSHAAWPLQPFVAPGPNRGPSRRARPLACNGDMNTTHHDAAVIPRLGRYDIDTSKSGITFRTRHLFGLGAVRGTFAFRAGTITIAEPLAESTGYAEIEAASFRTNSKPRDASVLSARFLDAGRFPLLRVRLGSLAEGEEGEAVVAGMLTVRDVTRAVSCTVTAVEASGQEFTARAVTRIDRNEFGVTAARGLAARHLHILLEVRCVRR